MALAACYITAMIFAVISLKNNETFDLLFITGFTVMEASVMFRMVSLHKLGKYFSYEIRISKEHKLIKEGPFAIIRHPLHLAFLGEVLGMAIISNSPWAWGATAVLLFVILHRNRVEDAVLEETFGDEFSDYKEKVPAINLISGLIRRLKR